MTREYFNFIKEEDRLFFLNAHLRAQNIHLAYNILIHLQFVKNNDKWWRVKNVFSKRIQAQEGIIYSGFP